jgi:iron complex outermembrane recepter protein
MMCNQLMLKISLFILNISICMLPNLASGQINNIERDSLDVKYEGDLIEVEATRRPRPVFDVPYAIDSLDKIQIQRGETGISLEENLRSVPGVIVNNRNNISQGDRISIRGLGSRASFGVRGIKIIQDGIPLTLADGQSQLNNVDLTSAGQIEVLRGPNSSLYGNAAGGVINILTQSAPDSPLQFTPRLIYGSNGLRRLQAKATGKIGRHQYLVNFNSLWLDGFRDHAFARSNGINAVGNHTVNENIQITTVFNFYKAPFQFNPSSLDKATSNTTPTSARFFVKSQGASKKITQGQGGVTLRYRDEKQSADVTVFGIGRALYNPIPGGLIDLSRKGGGVRGVYSRLSEIGGSPVRFTTGTDIELQSDNRQEFDNGGIPNSLIGQLNNERVFSVLTVGNQELNQHEQVLGIGPFIEFEWTPRPDIILTTGGRYDRFRFKVDDKFLSDNTDDSGTRTMDQFSPMVGLTYRPRPNIAFYGSYATSYQTPTTNELSNQPAQAGGFNPNLNPERLRGFETGLKGFIPNAGFSWDAALFAFRIRDMLLPFQINDPNTDEIYFRNAGKTQNIGIELKLTWSPISDFRTTVSYTGMKFEFKDFMVEREVNSVVSLFQLSGNELPGVPSHHFYGGISYTHPTSGAFFESNVQWISKFFGNDFNGPPPGSTKPVADFTNSSYSLVDLRVGIDHQFGFVGGEFFVGINNIFDTRYNGSITPNAFGDRFFEPASGRTWYMGFGVPIMAANR